MNSPCWAICFIFSIVGGLPSAWAAVSAVEARQLGSKLTYFGAEQEPNAEGSIPAYTGGIQEADFPADFQKGSGRWAEPFPEEKPLYSISSDNIDQFSDKLSETSQALLRRYPSYRMDIYPSHRSVSYPDWVLENSVNNATQARLEKDGLSVKGAFGGVPFPIPKNGYEVMWNHLLAYNGYPAEFEGRNWYVDSSGRAINTVTLKASLQSQYYMRSSNAENLKKKGNAYIETALHFLSPPNAAGNAAYSIDTLDPVKQPRRAWSYSAATRRIRVAPDLTYDTPVGVFGGILNFDDSFLYQGRLDLFDFTLLGKREMYIPYNNYRLVFQTSASQILNPNHLNPDFVRWELHRVWVVQAIRKAGVKHSSSKRLFYFDEDWGGAGMTDAYGDKGQLSKGIFMAQTPLYDLKIPLARSYWAYDIRDKRYTFAQHFGDQGMGFYIQSEGFPPLTFTPDALPRRAQ